MALERDEMKSQPSEGEEGEGESGGRQTIQVVADGVDPRVAGAGFLRIEDAALLDDREDEKRR